MKIVKAIKEGRYQERKSSKAGDEKNKSLFMIWNEEADEVLAESKRFKFHLPAPKMPLPGNAERTTLPPSITPCNPPSNHPLFLSLIHSVTHLPFHPLTHLLIHSPTSSHTLTHPVSTGHAESYNPPAEYLLTPEEQAAMEGTPLTLSPYFISLLYLLTLPPYLTPLFSQPRF